MTPPIRDGSGNSIGSIRLGDGTEISEVRTGAGDVLFSGTTIPDSVTSRTDDNSATSVNRLIGVVINPNSDFSKIAARISSGTDSVSRARLYDFSQSQYIETIDISGKSSNDAFAFSSSVKSGTNYSIEVDNDGSGYNVGFRDEIDYPYTGAPVDIVGRSNGATNENEQGSDTAGVNDIGNPDNILD